MTISGPEIAGKARAVLQDRKGEDIVLLDVRDLCSVTDSLLIVSGSSSPHLKALSGEVQKVLKQEGLQNYRKSGTPESGWMVIDYVDVVIHVFSREARAFYAIEDLWEQAPRME